MTTRRFFEKFEALAQLIHNMDRQLKVVEDKVDYIIHSTTPAAKSFPQFTRLPPELRLKIWDLAIPTRKLRHHAGDVAEERFDGTRKYSTTGLKPPAISRVCHESRSVALRRGRMFQLHRWHGQHDSNNYYWTWFDGSHDILELEDPECPILGQEDQCVELLRSAEVILMNMQDLGPWIKKLFRDQKVCETLRAILIQRIQSESVVITDWHPHAVARLFRKDTVAFIDVDDPAQVQDTLRLLSSCPQASGDPEFIRYRKRSRREAQRLNKGDKFTREWAVDMFEKAWYPRRYRLQRRLGLDGKRLLTSRHRKAISGMPRIRFVYTWELAEDGRVVESRDLVDPLHGAFSEQDISTLAESSTSGEGVDIEVSEDSHGGENGEQN